jgi:hypothetical protein
MKGFLPGKTDLKPGKTFILPGFIIYRPEELVNPFLRLP